MHRHLLARSMSVVASAEKPFLPDANQSVALNSIARRQHRASAMACSSHSRARTRNNDANVESDEVTPPRREKPTRSMRAETSCRSPSTSWYSAFLGSEGGRRFRISALSSTRVSYFLPIRVTDPSEDVRTLI